MTGTRTRDGDRAQQLDVVAGRGAVPVDRRDEELAGTERGCPKGPLDGVDPGDIPATPDEHLPPGRVAEVRRGPASGVDGDDHGLTAEPPGAARDEAFVGDGGRVERDLVRPGPQDGTHVVRAADAAPDGKRDERPSRRPFDDVQERATLLGRGADVEEDQLVGALGRVSGGELRWISLVDEVHEPGALDDPPAGDVEAGDDALPQHVRLDLSRRPRRRSGVAHECRQTARALQRTKLAMIRRPATPLRSGWNWTPRTLPRSIAETNRSPCPVSARIAASAPGASGRPA